MIKNDYIYRIKLRFDSHVIRGPNCWIWSGSTSIGGYGSFGWPGKTWKDWKSRRAHRVSYEFYVGPIPPGLDVLHKCDNPPCVRPSHLFLGTDFDNQQDALKKGRRADAKGIKNGNRKLTEEDVKDIRNFHPLVSERKLASYYGVKKAAIHKIVHRTRWSHV